MTLLLNASVNVLMMSSPNVYTYHVVNRDNLAAVEIMVSGRKEEKQRTKTLNKMIKYILM